jgi:hypothetical protein
MKKFYIAVLVLSITLSSSAIDFKKDTISLIKGKSMRNWQGDTGTWMNVGEATLNDADPKLLSAVEGSGTIVNGEDGRTHNLISTKEHGDCVLKLEFMVPKGSNSGVYLQGRYEIQVFDSYMVPGEDVHHSDCGGIYQRYDESAGRGYEGIAPLHNASRAPGQWQEYEIWFRAPRFNESGEKTENARFVKVIHNGILIHENKEVTGPTRAATWLDTEQAKAPFMLQGDHGPVAYRAIELTHTEF